MSDTAPVLSERITTLMRQLIDKTADSQTVTVGRILQAFGLRSFALLILVLSLLNVVIFMVPLISVLFGLPMVVLAVQMVLGFRTPFLPPVIRHRAIPAEPLHKGLEKGIYWVEKINRVIKPRLTFLSEPALVRIHAFLALMLAVMVALPIPVVNVPPALGLIALSLGILERDGYFIILAYVIGIWCLWLFLLLGHNIARLT